MQDHIQGEAIIGKARGGLVLLLAVLASRVAAEPGSALWPCPVFVPDSPYTDYPTGLEVEGDRVYQIGHWHDPDPDLPAFFRATER